MLLQPHKTEQIASNIYNYILTLLNTIWNSYIFCILHFQLLLLCVFIGFHDDRK
jgi:hypothetical protein